MFSKRNGSIWRTIWPGINADREGFGYCLECRDRDAAIEYYTEHDELPVALINAHLQTMGQAEMTATEVAQYYEWAGEEEEEEEPEPVYHCFHCGRVVLQSEMLFNHPDPQTADLPQPTDVCDLCIEQLEQVVQQQEQ